MMDKDHTQAPQKTTRKILPFPIVLAFWALIISGSYFWNVTNEEAYVEMFAKQRGKMVYSVIIATRLWSAEHGGLYAPITEISPENPYLKTFEKNITTPSGRKLTLINPAYMTRQLSELMEQTDVNIRLTSLKPLNPQNAPNEWEGTALKSFENGVTEIVGLLGPASAQQFNYMAPLLVKAPCMKCHRHQGYEIGDVRGGLRVSFPAQEILQIKEANQQKILFMHLATFILLSSLSLIAIRKIHHLIDGLQNERQVRDEIISEKTISLKEEIQVRKEKEDTLNKLIRTDPLTSINNRRSLEEFLDNEIIRTRRYALPMSLILMDLDFFKKVNDTYGHDVGDVVLQEFSNHVSSHLRESDFLARFGGEEFIVVMPHTDAKTAFKAIDRIRNNLALKTIETEDHSFSISMSFGVAQFNSDIVEHSHDLIKSADTALYQAKRTGRNKGVIYDMELA